jgi:hypothetical protein
LGRDDQALKAEQTAAATPENGQTQNVSQTIDLAGQFLLAGRAQDALTTLTPFNSSTAASPYGLAWVHELRACADAKLGRQDDASGELLFLSTHETDNSSAWMQALLCAGTPDEVSAYLVARLQNPDLNEGLLIDLSHFDQPPHATNTSFEIDQSAIWKQVRDRPEVQAAIAKAGHVERVPLCGCEFRDDGW